MHSVNSALTMHHMVQYLSVSTYCLLAMWSIVLYRSPVRCSKPCIGHQCAGCVKSGIGVESVSRARGKESPMMDPETRDALDVALSKAVEKLGYSTLREHQVQAVKAFVRGQDVFVSLPTGSGKSLCFCILPALFDILRGVEERSVVVIVSPLIALMKDQVRVMNGRGLKSVYVGDCESEDAVAAVCSGTYQLVYMSPEALLTD